MEEHIYEPNHTFDFSKLILTTPTVVAGGNYFIKYVMGDNNPLYVQPPKCTTKQGFVKTNGGKKIHCDLVFSNTNESFIKWLEDLEKYSQEYIFKNREKWFESQLEMEDIENSFAPSLKIYKSGKSYILRTIVPTRLGKCALKIFNEDETEFDADEFKETTNTITILEIQGIKCSSKSFQIDIEIKQMMVLKPGLLFDKCMINKSSGGHSLNIPIEKQLDPTESTAPPTPPTPPNDAIMKVSLGDVQEDGIMEVDFDFENIEETNPVNIKDRNEIYYNIYRDALKKAKDARNLAINSYLEVKKIKNLYLLDELSEEDKTDEEYLESEL
jgi:hypothetical protein